MDGGAHHRGETGDGERRNDDLTHENLPRSIEEPFGVAAAAADDQSGLPGDYAGFRIGRATKLVGKVRRVSPEADRRSDRRPVDGDVSIAPACGLHIRNGAVLHPTRAILR
jgi:hypothetical protein